MLIKYREYDFKNKKRYCLAVYKQIKRYCENPKSRFYSEYGGRGIQCEFTSAIELHYLYTRDDVDKMEEPNFIRKNQKGHFNRNNCRFIDREEYGKIVRKAVADAFNTKKVQNKLL